MFVRTKSFTNKDGSKRVYVQIVEGIREGTKVRQRVVATLGRLEDLQNGGLDRLVDGLAAFAGRRLVESGAQHALQGVADAREWGPALIFRRLWRDFGLRDLVEKLAAATRIEFPVEDAVFAMVLNRLVEPQSKLAASKWVRTVYDPGFRQLKVQHFYRAVDFLAEAKDQLEDGWFTWVRQNKPEELDLVLYDTTSTYFQGLGAEEIGEFGHSKDHRPDRKQVVIGVLMSRQGLPLAHEVFAGNTADVDTFREIIGRVQTRFRLRRVVLVADRGMVSKPILQAIEDCGLEYIVGMRMRRCREASQLLSRSGRYRVVAKNLRVKDLRLDGKRYVLCHNPLRASHEAQAREDALKRLERKVKEGGPRQFVGHRLYRRFLAFNGDAAVTIDRARVAQEARLDGKFILITNTDLDAVQVALAYKDLWRVERGFRRLKSQLDLRPIFHWTEARVRGHIVICFLALILDSLLRRALQEAGVKAPMADLMRDLRQLRAATVECGGKTWLARTDLQGNAFQAFKAIGCRPPDRLTPLPA